MPSGIYNSYKTLVLSPTGVNLGSDTIKVALLTNAYNPDFDAHDFFNDVSAFEVSGAGYTAGGQALANKAVTQDNTNDQGKFDADDLTWPGSTFTARYAVIYKDSGVASTSPLIGVIDFLTDRTALDATFSIQWQSVGILLAQ